MTEKKGLVKLLDIEFIVATSERVEAVMPINSDLYQPFGFLHGGATIALLETVASVGAELNTDLEKDRPFGIDVQIKHKKSGREGNLLGVATLGKVEKNKQYWDVVAYDDAGDIISDGVIVTKIVSLERLAEKEKQARRS